MTAVLPVPTPAPLRHRNFRLLVTGASIGALGNAITPVALAFAVLDLGGSASELGLVVAAFALAEVLTTLFGGVLGDRMSRRLMMSGSAAGSAVVQAVVAGSLVLDLATIPLLTGLGVLTGCLSALSQPSASAMTRLTVPADVLSRAIALRSLLQTTASMVGFAVGGLLVAGIGSGWSIAVDAASFAVAAGCYAALRVEQAPAVTGGTLLADLAEGFAEVRTRRWLWVCILMALAYHLMFGGAQGVVGPIVVGEGIGRQAWGFALGAMMVGFVAGGLLCLRWHPRRGLFYGSLFLCLTPLFPLAMVTDNLAVILAGAVLHGFGLQVFDVQWNASIQEQVPDDKLSRVYSVDIAGSFVARPIGLALTGPLAEAVGFDNWLLVVAGVMLAAEVLPLLVRDVRGWSGSDPAERDLVTACAVRHTRAMDAPEPQFVDDRLAHWASADPEGECLTYGQRTWTWAQLHDRVRRVAGGLRDLGVGRGDVVAFLDKNHPACVELSLGAGLVGAANAVVNWRLAGDEVGFTLNDCGATVLVVGSELMPAVAAIRAELPTVERVIEVTPDGAEGDPYESWLAASAPIDRDPAVTPDDTCLVLYSSGTTGRPKGVLLTHRNFVRHTIDSHDGWEFEPGDKNLVAMPLFHVGGSSYVLFGLHDGIPSVMTREPDGASLATAIMQGANRMFLVPAVLAQVIRSGQQGIEMFGRLKSFTYGASPMPPPLLRAAMKTWPDMDLMQVYGLTEVCGVATHLLPEEHRNAEAEGHPERLLSAGRAIPGMEVRIVDPATLEDRPTGAPGEIWLRSEQVMKGFLGRPEETRKVLTEDGWFRTGDIGRIDADGFVYVEDRLKDMIISGGENIYSPEVERVLAEHPAVLECAVVGVPDERWGEAVRAYVAVTPGATATEADIIDFCREHLARFKCPSSVVFLDALPRNPTGKILKRDLRGTAG